MIVKEVKSAIKDATAPIVKVLQKSEHVKVIVLGFKKGLGLKEHKTNVATKLVVIEGSINYTEGGASVIIDSFEDMDIPVNAPHAVEALEDSICFLIQG
jgi:quercetin dioxygenase-like cupin family protein